MNTPSYNSILIQNISPSVEDGKYPVKKRVGQAISVKCEAFRHGHDAIKLCIKYRHSSQKNWSTAAMVCSNSGLDTFEGDFKLSKTGRYEFYILGYTDHYANWVSDTKKRRKAGEDLKSELIAGEQLISACRDRAGKTKLSQINKCLKDLSGTLDLNKKADVMLADEMLFFLEDVADTSGVDTGKSKTYSIRVDRTEAEFASWYEIFPRSAGYVEGQSGTFKDVEKRLPYISGMGFDVLYFTPIHPIGLQKRKGKNNSLTAKPGEPGSPYAIGDQSGGHFSVHPELGTLADFDQLVKECAKYGIEIALDIALNCSPDHPYLLEHPDWFYKRPDGTIKFAENPPKKYEDIYPLNFECEDRANLWNEIRDMFLFWAEHGVKTFRVDNPHTKPIQFWEWCIAEVHSKFDDVIFLSEAFTKPRVMESLAKIGYAQSYGYFTWRESKEELTEYFDYLNNTDVKDYMICNVFPTTPDILPKHLQNAPKEMFKLRLVMATTLSPVYGMYSGYELCENTSVGYKDELLNSEKYEFKVRNFDDPESIAPLVTKLNGIRKSNPALQIIGNLKFHTAHNDNILFYTKYVEGNLLLIFVNLDPYTEQSAGVHFPYWEYQLPHDYKVHDLLTDAVYNWHGADNFISLNPKLQPAHIFRVF